MKSYKLRFLFLTMIVVFSGLYSCYRKADATKCSDGPVWSTYYANRLQLYVVGHDNGSITLHGRDTVQVSSTYAKVAKRGITTSLFSYNDSLLLLSSMDSCITIFSVYDGMFVKQKHLSKQVYTAMFATTGYNYGVCGTDSCFTLYDYSTDSIIVRFKHPNYVNFFWFSGLDSQVVTSCQDGAIYVWNISRKTLLHKLEGHNGMVRCVYSSINEGLLVSTGTDSAVIVWNLPSGTIRHTLRGHRHGTQVAMFNPDGSQVVSSDDGGWLLLWDVASGTLLRRVKAHTQSICALHYDPSGRKLITGSLDGCVKEWYMPSLVPVSKNMVSR